MDLDQEMLRLDTRKIACVVHHDLTFLKAVGNPHPSYDIFERSS